MKRLVVRGPKGSVRVKGISVDENSEPLVEVINRVKILFDDHGITGLKAIFPVNGAVEVEDLEFLRDGDELIAVKNPDELYEDDWVTLNVGGTIFSTTKSTLCRFPESMLGRMFSNDFMSPGKRDKDGNWLIDRSAKYFEPILNYLRSGELILDPNLNPKGVYEEARYFGIDELISKLETVVENSMADERPLTRRDVINAIIKTPVDSELRFQAVNLAGADLSRLDLRKINFKYAVLTHANLKGTNLSGCNLERANLNGALLDGANLSGVFMLCANLQNSSLKGCNFDGSINTTGARAVLEGANLRHAVLEDSTMTGVNLRVANLKHSNMKNCYLRSAVLAGADLEFCDLTGSDLCEANLRGANLKDCLLELMPTPLHMSQTIR